MQRLEGNSSVSAIAKVSRAVEHAREGKVIAHAFLGHFGLAPTLVQFVPGGAVGGASDEMQHRGAQIGIEPYWILAKFCIAVVRFGEDVGIAEIAKVTDQGGTQKADIEFFAGFALPAEPVECRAQA